jgi:hypothetical protein
LALVIKEQKRIYDFTDRTFCFAVCFQINCNNYSSVEGLWIFTNLINILGLFAFSHLLMPVAHITRLPILCAYGMSGVVFWIGEGNGEEREKER